MSDLAPSCFVLMPFGEKRDPSRPRERLEPIVAALLAKHEELERSTLAAADRARAKPHVPLDL